LPYIETFRRKKESPLSPGHFQSSVPTFETFFCRQPQTPYLVAKGMATACVVLSSERVVTDLRRSMPNKAAAFNTAGTAQTSDLKEKVSDAAGQVQDKLASVGRNAADKIDENREGAASGLEKAASTLHDKADSLPGGEKVTSIAHATADKLSSTAEYVREHDVRCLPLLP
jgi:ElaB/YqjD/DUF883 family membrane-anchored ribosome-binding protein